MGEITFEGHFSSAHRLTFYKGNYKCKNLHGHLWRVKIEVLGENDKNGMLIDYGRLKDVLKDLDHTTILKKCDENMPIILGIRGCNCSVKTFPFEPTAENLATYLAEKVLSLDLSRIKTVKATVKESPNTAAVGVAFNTRFKKEGK